MLDQVHFKKIYNDWIRPTLVIFLTFFEKKYNNWIKSKLSKSKFKWTGLFRSVYVITAFLFRKNFESTGWFLNFLSLKISLFFFRKTITYRTDVQRSTATKWLNAKRGYKKSVIKEANIRIIKLGIIFVGLPSPILNRMQVSY